MNIVLFEEGELEISTLSCNDPRALHIKNVLKLSRGDHFKAGLIDGPQGEALIESIENGEIRLSFSLKESSSPLFPLTVLLGTPRPPVSRRLVKDLTTLGVRSICFVAAELGEKSYLSSRLWEGSRLRAALCEGACQAGETLLPCVKRYWSLQKALSEIPAEGVRYFLEAEGRGILESISLGEAAFLAVGPERGWSFSEKRLLQEACFAPFSLGQRTLRTETATLVGASCLLKAMGMT